MNIKQKLKSLEDYEIDRIVEMAWEDRTPFDAIETQFGVTEKEVIKIMQNEMKPSSFRMWRARVQGRSTKHVKKREFDEGRFKCSRQKGIALNTISKRS
ncbi:MAG: TIGR03643 family protein [Cyclobacteriaceae bacterium]|nr:TIGR03643 family protein [Cyclobacteriaceae bacterium]MCH8517321.1 TIGR03643 family protein [Cyclobacteriaceae bacterium]